MCAVLYSFPFPSVVSFIIFIQVEFCVSWSFENLKIIIEDIFPSKVTALFSRGNSHWIPRTNPSPLHLDWGSVSPWRSPSWLIHLSLLLSLNLEANFGKTPSLNIPKLIFADVLFMSASWLRQSLVSEAWEAIRISKGDPGVCAHAWLEGIDYVLMVSKWLWTEGAEPMRRYTGHQGGCCVRLWYFQWGMQETWQNQGRDKKDLVSLILSQPSWQFHRSIWPWGTAVVLRVRKREFWFNFF